jgi:hypothetical protein
MDAPEPVSAVIKVCALDAPYLSVTVPHMLAQAKYPFAERLLLADPRTSFTGKYATRADRDFAVYERVLAELEARGIVDRVIWATGTPADVESTLNLYFQGQRRNEWSHDRTGAPVYSALLGLELARHDYVVLFDADMLFHSAGPSWVAEGVAELKRAPDTWFVMTHAGPPPAPIGTPGSLGPRNASGHWNAERRVWSFRHMTSRYFLADRRRLRVRVPAVCVGDQLEPLEICFSAALRQTGSHRVNLALEGSWDLHAHDHGPPFPTWADRIAILVSRGVVPRHQLGDYDLKLRRGMHRIPWRALLQREFPDFNPFKT